MAPETESEFEELLQDAGLAMLFEDFEDALEIFDEAEALAESDLQRALCLAGRAALAIRLEMFAEAVDELNEAIELAGDEAPESMYGNLGFALDRLHRYDEAAAAHRQCIALHEREDGRSHPLTLRKRGDLAYSMIGLGLLDEAEKILRDVVRGFARKPAREPQWYMQALNNLGCFQLRSRNDPEEAMRTFDRAESLRDLCGGFLEGLEAMLLQNRAEACEALGRTLEAEELRERAGRLRIAAQRNPFRDAET